MAIGRISGQVLKSNLYREDVDISFSNFPGDVPLLYFNISNNFLGVNTDTPTTELEVSGTSTTTNLVSTALSNLGDVQIQNNSIASTLGDLNLSAATPADKLVIASDTDINANVSILENLDVTGDLSVLENLVVDKDITTTNGTIFGQVINVGGGITIGIQGGPIPFSASALDTGMHTVSPMLAENGDATLKTDGVNFVIIPDDGNKFGVDGPMEIDGSLTMVNGSDLVFLNAAGEVVFRIDGETGAMESEGPLEAQDLSVDDIFINDNFIEIATPDTDLILRSGPADSASSDPTRIELQSITEVLKDFKITGPDAKLIIDNELEIDGTTIESYASDLNFIVNNLEDSTVNTFNFYGNTNNYGYVFIEHDLDVVDTITSNTSVVNRITTNTGNLFIDVASTGIVNVNDTVNVVDHLTADRITVNQINVDDNIIRTQGTGIDLRLEPESTKVVIENTLELDNLISNNTILGAFAEIDDVRINNNTISSINDANLNFETPNPGITYFNFNSSLEVQGNIHATGTISADGDLIFGDEDTDNILFNADINSNILPNINSDGTTGYTIGLIDKHWKNVFTRRLTVDGYTADKIDNNEFNIENNPSDTAMVTQGALARFSANVSTGDRIPIGPPDDSTYDDGAFIRSAETDELGDPKPLDVFDDTMKISQAVDLLNESLNNIRNNTFIRSVDYTATPPAAGSGTTVTLNLDVDGTHTQAEVDWDVTGVLAAQGVTDTKEITYPAGTPVSFTYNAVLGGLFTVRVVVRNTDAQFPGSAGTDAEEEKVDFIIIYTPDPVADFDLYRSLTGGTALSGNLLYVTEGSFLALENLTTNTGVTLGAGNTATYSIDWGDGTPLEDVDSDTDPGGRDGARVSHTFADGTSTGTGVTDVVLTIETHSTADPAVIPNSASKTIKIYENDPGTPDFIDSKTITFASPQGLNPRLASGFTDNSAVSTTTAGQSVNRTVRTTGTINTDIIPSLIYSSIGNASDFDFGNPPVVSSLVNDSVDGSVTFSAITGANIGTYDSLQINSETDFNLFNSNGVSIPFAETIFFPGAFGGFQARIAEDAADVPVGLNTYQIRQETPSGTYNTNVLDFVKDDVTGTVTLGGGIVAEGNAGNYRYISGVPYYNANNPSLILSGITADSWIGQTYASISNVVEVRNGLSNIEGQSFPAISNTNYDYADINNGASTYLSGGIPQANTGNGTPYTLANLIVPITSSAIATVDTVRYRMRNVNGYSSFVEKSTKIAVFRSNQGGALGISEIAIEVDNSLGNGVFTDDGVRIFNFANDPVDNPVFSSTGVNYYTNNPYTESSDPGVVGTQEATIRFGVLEHNTEDYSFDFLPVGPDRSGDTGRQYFTFAFRRQVVANFGIRIVSSSGVAGVWIAAPGTAIDTASSINGWLDCSIQYAGAGVPGGDSDNGGNGSNGCAITGNDIVNPNSSLNGQFNMTLGAENMSNATDNVVLVRIALDAGQEITTLEIKEA